MEFSRLPIFEDYIMDTFHKSQEGPTVEEILESPEKFIVVLSDDSAWKVGEKTEDGSIGLTCFHGTNYRKGFPSSCTEEELLQYVRRVG